MIAHLFIGNNSLYRITQMSEKRMNELCSTAGVKISRVLEDVDSIYWDHVGGARLQLPIDPPAPTVYNGTYNGYSFGTYKGGASWVRSGRIRFVEWPNRPNSKNNTITARYERYMSDQNSEYIDALAAQVGVIGTKLTNEDDKKYGITGYEISIRVLSTGEVTATNRYFYNKKTRQVCGYVENRSFSDTGFIFQAIGKSTVQLEPISPNKINKRW